MTRQQRVVLDEILEELIAMKTAHDLLGYNAMAEGIQTDLIEPLEKVIKGW